MTPDYKALAQLFTPYPPQSLSELAWRLKKEGYPQPTELHPYQVWYNLGLCRIETRFLWGALFQVRFDKDGRQVMRSKLRTTEPGNMIAFLPTVKQIKQWVT